MKTLSLVVPVYNAQDLARKIAGHIPILEDAARECGFELKESIFVDDGSDVPLENIPRVKILRHEKNKGKGKSVRDGVLAASGEWVLMSDVDESVPLSEFNRLAAKTADDVWIVCGSRKGRPGMPLKRKILSKIFSFFISWITGNQIMDTQCGFKLFRTRKMRPIFENLQIKRFAFDVEVITSAVKQGGKVVEESVTWHGGKRSSLKVFKDAPRMLWDILCLKFSRKKSPRKE